MSDETPTFPEPPASKVCEHGSLRRKCEICERDEEIAELKADRDEARALYTETEVKLSAVETENLHLRAQLDPDGDAKLDTALKQVVDVASVVTKAWDETMQREIATRDAIIAALQAEKAEMMTCLHAEPGAEGLEITWVCKCGRRWVSK